MLSRHQRRHSNIYHERTEDDTLYMSYRDTAVLAARYLRDMWKCFSNIQQSTHQAIEERLIGNVTVGEITDRIPEIKMISVCNALIPTKDSKQTGTEIHHRLPDHNNVTQAEIKSITDSLKRLCENKALVTVNVFTDNQCEIRAIKSDSRLQ